ncbi:MAG: prepilin-type N-terminal cleavage/methylation domain-containing protein [Candidatus Gracilibacteria bacterium]|nr:prepilin-type N-terminal cleavage/methylation domain-containing protein [Candidatus Gracilibacteria bacterium]
MDLVKIKNSSKKAFTLIELLVVITIIGILATGAVSVYTSQIQKARDTTRINDVEALKSGVEQFYQDKNQYPSVLNSDAYYFTGVTTYTPKLPKDPKNGQTCNGDGTNTPMCGYIYGVSSDNNGIEYGEYEISTAYENAGNRTSKAIGDNGNDTLRYEVGLDVGDTTNHKTDCNITSKIVPVTMTDIAAATVKCTTTTASVISGGVGSIFIAGN